MRLPSSARFSWASTLTMVRPCNQPDCLVLLNPLVPSATPFPPFSLLWYPLSPQPPPFVVCHLPARVSLPHPQHPHISPIAGSLKNHQEVDMNVVRICFQASYRDQQGQMRRMDPVLSEPVYDKSESRVRGVSGIFVGHRSWKGPCTMAWTNRLYGVQAVHCPSPVFSIY